ncbi:hypothetical protein ANME2D_03412 [Candidatus Methanoperedens nitroreducens]|uniref:Uncharacterized protein n=1 Tax=Candidatus Methanoperedens nitratireducens TaxID=1392998 RepID=A0A062UTB6_9EURY|nr:hypothetical protein [Candidatus Methanoperedens nitroreducens]KCZ70296.1 hypothetical protein ANME2D_03412 [Candidatus Methanoperedens nitroreducens]MDJ1421334.1 hypothetical protein [Candidatus Methanoperedens sp.]
MIFDLKDRWISPFLPVGTGKIVFVVDGGGNPYDFLGFHVFKQRCEIGVIYNAI